MEKEEFIAKFNENFGSYIYVDRVVLENFYDNYQVKWFGDHEAVLDIARDYVLSQGLAEEVIE